MAIMSDMAEFTSKIENFYHTRNRSESENTRKLKSKPDPTNFGSSLDPKPENF